MKAEESYKIIARGADEVLVKSELLEKLGYAPIQTEFFGYLINKCIYTASYTASKYNAKWIEKTIVIKDQSSKEKKNKHFDLEYDAALNLDNLIRKLLKLSVPKKNGQSNQNNLSLLIFFPSSKFSKHPSKKKELHICWDIFESTLTTKTTNHEKAAILTALQLLNIGDDPNSIAAKLVNETFFNDIFKSKPDKKELEELNLEALKSLKVYLSKDEQNKLKNSNEYQQKQLIVKRIYRGNVILKNHMVEKNTIITKGIKSNSVNEQILRATSNISSSSNSRAPISYSQKTVNERVKHNEKQDNINQEYDKLGEGLSIILSQFPGILCHLNIPVASHIKEPPSQTWILGPKRWIEFLDKSPEKLKSNDDNGSRDRYSTDEFFEDDGTPKPTHAILNIFS